MAGCQLNKLFSPGHEKWVWLYDERSTDVEGSSQKPPQDRFRCSQLALQDVA
jgi:hypothetical protein